jgi:hypothetical protein
MTVSNSIGETARFDERQADRATAELNAVVQVKEADGKMWKEFTEVRSVSRNGAGFCLTRPCIVGRLITIVMPLDPDLRAYDQDNELYPVMGIVQYCNAATVDEGTVYHVGVGFIGKKIPDSFKNDPTQSFRISGMSKDGLWQVAEAQNEFKQRRDPRFWTAIGVTVSLIRRQKGAVVKEETFTKNVSASGVSVACRLEAEIGDKVKIAAKELNFYAVAVVRNINRSKPDHPTMHVEFVDSEFPIEKLIDSQTLRSEEWAASQSVM